MSLKDVPVRARLWAPDRSLPRFFWETSSFFCQIQPYVFCPVPSGGGNARRCRSSAPCCTLGRRRCTKVSLKRAVLHSRATIKHESVAQESRAVPSGNDKYGFRCRRVSFIHTSFCPAPLGNGKARKSRLTVPRVTFGCGTVRRHRSRRARRRPMLLSLEGFRGGAVAWSCGHYIGHYIRHIRLIFGNFYYCCPEACHTASRPVPVTQGRSGIQTERVTDGCQVIYQSIAELIGLTRL